MSLIAVLTLIFLVLKLCGVIAWPWVYVFLPIITVVVLVLGAILLFLPLVSARRKS